MSTHLNAQYVSVAILWTRGLRASSLKNRCTLCSCGQSFTDPSACTRHREATGHEKGSTYGKIRPTTIRPVKIQHLAGLSLNLEKISDPNFIPPPFDESFHLKGMPKQKAQEKYDSNNYVTIGSGAPNIPSTQMTEILLINGAPVAEYQETVPIERRAPAHTEIQVDKLDLNVDFSYDVELPREPQCSQGISQNPYTEYHGSSITHTRRHQLPSDGYYTPPEVNPLPPSYPATTLHVATDANFCPQQYPENYPTAVTDHFPAPPQPVAEPHPSPVPILQASLGMPPYHDPFGEMGFIISEALEQTQFQYFYHPNDHFNYMYQPASAAY